MSFLRCFLLFGIQEVYCVVSAHEIIVDFFSPSIQFILSICSFMSILFFQENFLELSQTIHSVLLFQFFLFRDSSYAILIFSLYLPLSLLLPSPPLQSPPFFPFYFLPSHKSFIHHSIRCRLDLSHHCTYNLIKKIQHFLTKHTNDSLIAKANKHFAFLTHPQCCIKQW